MIDWFIDTFLGVWGRAAVDFYGTYALPINTGVVLYGAMLLYWNRQLRPFRHAAVQQVAGMLNARRAKPDAKLHGTKLHADVARKLDWEQVAAVGPGRLVAGRWRLWPTRASAEKLPRLLPIAELCRDAQEAR